MVIVSGSINFKHGFSSLVNFFTRHHECAMKQANSNSDD